MQSEGIHTRANQHRHTPTSFDHAFDPIPDMDRVFKEYNLESRRTCLSSVSRNGWGQRSSKADFESHQPRTMTLLLTTTLAEIPSLNDSYA